jgi:subtilisin family serine protease
MLLSEAHEYAFWQKPDGVCPACVQQSLLQTLLSQGDAALHEQIQSVWPLDAAAAFGALPTPLRLHADPRFTGRGITLAVLDTGFYPHPDLTQPHNRIRAWVNATTDPVTVRRFQSDDSPRWPGWDAGLDNQWHGTMTAAVAAGNGYLSYGSGTDCAMKPELVAPSIWVAASVLPGTPVAREAVGLFQQRGEPAVEARIAELKLITPHYQHVDGTSFASSLVASAVACQLEANTDLSPAEVRRILQQTAKPIPAVPRVHKTSNLEIISIWI